MDLVKEYRENTNFKTMDDFLQSLANVFMIGSIKSDYKKEKTIKSKEGINDLTIQFLEDILNNGLAKTKQEKLAIVTLLDELNYRNEVLRMMEKETKSSVTKASKTIGKKFVSSIG